jgi:hypothetical protein
VSVAAVVLLLPNTLYAWVFASSMTALAVAWMVRSYVTTFAFVSFRVLYDALLALHVGTDAERIGAAGWFCWSVPLLLTELVIQGRKILAARPRRVTASPA